MWKKPSHDKISDYDTMYNMGWRHAHLLLNPVKTDNEAYMDGWNAYHETLRKLEVESEI